MAHDPTDTAPATEPTGTAASDPNDRGAGPNLRPGSIGNDASWDRETEDQPGPALLIDLSGFEGPLDLLLALARTHKIDLTALSMGALAEQYLDYLSQAVELDLDQAADYLVMAAWLTFLKSRLLIPKPTEAAADELSAPELAAQLAFRLKRLEAMRAAVQNLFARPLLARDIFARTGPAAGTQDGFSDREQARDPALNTATAPPETIVWRDQLPDLVRAYARVVDRRIRPAKVAPPKRQVWSIGQARARLEEVLGVQLGWFDLFSAVEAYLASLPADHPWRRSAAQQQTIPPSEPGAPNGGPETPAGGGVAASLMASSFGATLELVREGLAEVEQDRMFGPLRVKARQTAGAPASGHPTEPVPSRVPASPSGPEPSPQLPLKD